ncbi:unnamed protein product, partial [Ceratitis capitata]
SKTEMRQTHWQPEQTAESINQSGRGKSGQAKLQPSDFSKSNHLRYYVETRSLEKSSSNDIRT